MVAARKPRAIKPKSPPAFLGVIHFDNRYNEGRECGGAETEKAAAKKVADKMRDYGPRYKMIGAVYSLAGTIKMPDVPVEYTPITKTGE